MISTLFYRKWLGFKLAVFLSLPIMTVVDVMSGNDQLPSGTQEVRDLLAFRFDSNAPVGSAQNPAVIIPAASGLLVDLPVAKRTGDLLLVPVAELQKVANQPLARVIRWVEERKGLPYRWPIVMGLDSNDETRFYCSQLVWRAYKQNMNVDLDADRGALVFPDDLYHSKDVAIIVP